jgi:uncharacterized membrane protein YeiH
MTYAFDNSPVWLDLLGVFFFAVSGSLLAARKQIDIVGSLLLASLVGLGGGVIRDIILSIVPAAFTNPAYLAPPLLATVLVFFLFSSVQRYTSLLILFDAAGLALFCMTGTLKALATGLNPVASVLLGVTTAVGGGLLRDITANEVPELFNPKDIYALPAFVGSAMTAVLWVLGPPLRAWFSRSGSWPGGAPGRPPLPFAGGTGGWVAPGCERPSGCHFEVLRIG